MVLTTLVTKHSHLVTPAGRLRDQLSCTCTGGAYENPELQTTVGASATLRMVKPSIRCQPPDTATADRAIDTLACGSILGSICTKCSGRHNAKQEDHVVTPRGEHGDCRMPS